MRGCVDSQVRVVDERVGEIVFTSPTAATLLLEVNQFVLGAGRDDAYLCDWDGDVDLRGWRLFVLTAAFGIRSKTRWRWRGWRALTVGFGELKDVDLVVAWTAQRNI